MEVGPRGLLGPAVLAIVHKSAVHHSVHKLGMDT